jgi:hypothetical protein
MMTQAAVRDGGLARSGSSAIVEQAVGCRAELSSELLDEQGRMLDDLIGFAFDILGACYLDVRVVPTEAPAAVRLYAPPTSS